VPGDRLAFAVFVCRQVEDRGVLDQGLQLLQVVLLLRRDHVERLEVVLDVDAELRPFLLLQLRRHLAGVAGQVPDVPDAGLDAVVLAEELADRARLRGRLDDDDRSAGGLLAAGHAGGGGGP
jgi:hypothetical protein